MIFCVIVLVMVWEYWCIFLIGGKIVVFGLFGLIMLLSVWLVVDRICWFIFFVFDVISFKFKLGYINVLFVWLIL